MVFAAGLGSRLGAISKTTPKCLVEVGGKAMLLWVLERLGKAGVTEVVVNVHYLREKVEEYLAKTTLPVKVTISPEATLLGTGGGLKFARQFFRASEPFFVHNADIFSDLDLKMLMAAHRPASLATLAVMRRETSRALLFGSASRLVGWENGDGKCDRLTAGGEAAERLAFSGIQVVSPRIFDYLELDEGNFSIITTYMRCARAGEAIEAFRIDDALWVDVGTPEKLERLRQAVDRDTKGT